MNALFTLLVGTVAGWPGQVFPAPEAESDPAVRSGPEAVAVAVAQPSLEAEAARFAEAWSASNTDYLVGVMAADGIRLHLPEEEHVLIRPRQARAAMDAFLERYGAGETRLTRAPLAGGSTDRGFAEIQWNTTSPGLPDPVIFTLFVGYVLKNDRWTVTEIRVLFR